MSQKTSRILRKILKDKSERRAFKKAFNSSPESKRLEVLQTARAIVKSGKPIERISNERFSK